MAIKISEEENGEVCFIRHLQKKFRKMRMKRLISGIILLQLFIKIKAVIRAKGNVGKHIATLLPLGYKKGPNDKEKW